MRKMDARLYWRVDEGGFAHTHPTTMEHLTVTGVPHVEGRYKCVGLAGDKPTYKKVGLAQRVLDGTTHTHTHTRTRTHTHSLLA